MRVCSTSFINLVTCEDPQSAYLKGAAAIILSAESGLNGAPEAISGHEVLESLSQSMIISLCIRCIPVPEKDGTPGDTLDSARGPERTREVCFGD